MRGMIHYADDRLTLHGGNCLAVLRADDLGYDYELGYGTSRAFPDASVDAVVTDPPYGLEFMGKDWDRPWAATIDPRGDRRGVIDPATWGGTQDPSGGNAYSRSRVRHGGSTGYSGAAAHPATVGRAFGEWCELWAAECLRVLKPGGHLLAFGGARMAHRLIAAVEDSGFEVRDSIAWLYGSGFPKSMDVSKAIDATAGATREVLAEGTPVKRMIPGADQNATGSWIKDNGREFVPTVTAPATPQAQQWQGWGTALKPAYEPIVVARKPLRGTVAANVLEHGTGAINVDACRFGDAPDPASWSAQRTAVDTSEGRLNQKAANIAAMNAGLIEPPTARWPANVVMTHSADCRPLGQQQVRSRGHHPASRGPGGVSTVGHTGQDGLTERPSGVEPVTGWACAPDCPVSELDDQSGTLTSGANPARRGADKFRDAYGDFKGQEECVVHRGANTGGASRFFPQSHWTDDDAAHELTLARFRYEAKAGTGERPRAGAVAHPTVKPLALMRWLVRLVTPPGGLVLEPFAGSGTTAEACMLEGFRCAAIEREPDYLPLIVQRVTRRVDPVAYLTSRADPDDDLGLFALLDGDPA
jgi:DNA modification methylase